MEYYRVSSQWKYKCPADPSQPDPQANVGCLQVSCSGVSSLSFSEVRPIETQKRELQPCIDNLLQVDASHLTSNVIFRWQENENKSLNVMLSARDTTAFMQVEDTSYSSWCNSSNCSSLSKWISKKSDYLPS